MRNWWSEANVEQFQARTQQIHDQFDGLETENGTVDGALTLDENIADNAGLSVALDALKQHEDYDLQEFFTSYARSWATLYQLSARNGQHDVDVRSPCP
ncbi:hypothetical protein HZY86_01975 [Aerococcaceae bacterium DSM 111020]|nr:hypothetical protein [Aerococcaceae bacterium DSM 111020]